MTAIKHNCTKFKKSPYYSKAKVVMSKYAGDVATAIKRERWDRTTSGLAELKYGLQEVLNQIMLSDSIVAKPCGDKDYGVFALRDLKPGLIKLYGIPRNSGIYQKDIHSITTHPLGGNIPEHYMAMRSDEVLLDGAAYFCNHSCDPNAELKALIEEETGRAYYQVKLTKYIRKGQEICITYGKMYFQAKNMTCLCQTCLAKPKRRVLERC